MKRKIPSTYVIVFIIIVISAVLTWFVPGGKYVKKETVVNGKKIIQNAFTYIESKPQSWQIFSALYKGFVKQSGIIIFILMIGGAFWIMNSSKAIDVGISSFLRKAKKVENNKIIKKVGIDNLILIIIMLIFSVFGAVFGMSEETIPFIIIIVPLAISMGYDSITGVFMVFVAAGLGFAGAVLNPFTIGIAQGLSNVPLYSGIEYRLFCWSIINLFGFFYIIKYAKKVKLSPKASIVFEDDSYWRNKNEQNNNENIKYIKRNSSWITYILVTLSLILFSIKYPVTILKAGNSSLTLTLIPVLTIIFILIGAFLLKKTVHFFILFLLFYTMLFLIVGVMGYSWGIMEIASLFFALGIVSGASMGYSPDKIVKLFMEGVKDIQSAALIVGLAGGIIIILEDGKIVDTILHTFANLMGGLGSIATVGIMFIIQTMINIIIPSASAKAALTMPIMAPFSDIVGISRQATIMAYQFGDGFTNMITPTSGVLIAVLGIARIPYEKWVKWIFPFIVFLSIIGFILLIPTVTMNLKGF